MKAHDRHLAYGTAADCSDDALDILWVDHLAGGEPRTSRLTGTKALMLAVFEDGIRCYLGGIKRIAAEAEDWLNSRRRNSPFVFVVLCETFGLDPQAVRETVKQMKREHRSAGEIIPRVRNNVRVPGRVSLRKRRRHRRSAIVAFRRSTSRVVELYRGEIAPPLRNEASRYRCRPCLSDPHTGPEIID